MPRQARNPQNTRHINHTPPPLDNFQLPPQTIKHPIEINIQNPPPILFIILTILNKLPRQIVKDPRDVRRAVQFPVLRHRGVYPFFDVFPFGHVDDLAKYLGGGNTRF